MTADEIIQQIVQVAAYRVWEGTVMCRNRLVKTWALDAYRQLTAVHGPLKCWADYDPVMN